MALRIIVTDDHAIVRRGIRQILTDELPGTVIVEAQNGDEAIEQIRKGSWDLLILDISMNGRSGLEVLADVKAMRPNLPVLILSMHPEDQMAVRVLKVGAAGYMTKDSAPDDLVAAVSKIVSGGRYVSENLAQKLVMDLARPGEEQPHELLSNREFEVMRLIASGVTVSEIAKLLVLSVKTVSTYRSRVLEKMRMATNAELTQYAVRNHLIG